MNGQLKRILPTVEQIEVLTTAMRTMDISTQRVVAGAMIRPLRTATFRPVPHFAYSVAVKLDCNL